MSNPGQPTPPSGPPPQYPPGPQAGVPAGAPSSAGAGAQPPAHAANLGYQPDSATATGPAAAGYPAAAGHPDAPQTAQPYGVDDRGHVRGGKVSSAWIGLVAAGIVLLLLIIFIAQNMNSVGLHFLGFYGRVSVGLALLVAAVGGVLVAAVPGSIRILQLRHSLRRTAAALNPSEQGRRHHS